MKLIAIDLDGTLLSPEMEITKESLEAMREAQNQGNIVMICSGRAPEDIQQILRKYDFSIPLAGSNGTVVQTQERVLKRVSMNREDVGKIAEKLDDERTPYRIYTDSGIYIPADWSERVELAMKEEQIEVEGLPDETYQRITEKPQKSSLINFFDHYSELVDEKELTIQKFFVLTLNNNVKTALTAYLEGISTIGFTSSHPLNIEVMDQDGNKGNALKRVAEHYGISLNDTVAIGDNFNDIPMLEMAGLSVAMGNAEPLVKEICDFVTRSNADNGVAYAINNYVLNK
ncbi:Cof-type HAD-IIB family hydrolase [Planomicrobium sp. CPCC 101079]|uniref:Cof-type HAD-IIB family hydrolase n=1 Tax=Planomicrobium sp. CPCC 101079 TaxID=2599618 RepID=UPI0011B4FE1A|nr:Cof-type HAD-IIB family hydrolase [Planomicrobium sp. CPCC 101079]TWT01887.1 HAD family phosphatase [Planomicrobium sp. CPCC 101079]